jgi:magnesium transporter
MLEQLVLPDLRQAIHEQDWESLREFCAILHPPIISQVLDELADFELIWSAFMQIQPPARILVFEYLSGETQDRIVVRLPKAELAILLERMSHDDRVDLVKRMDPDQQQLIMPLVARAEREDILHLKSYEEGTAGSIMTTDYAALAADLTVDEALQKLRQIAPDRETIYYIYVTDSERHLVGFVSLKDLIRAGPRQTLDAISVHDVLMVPDDMDVEEVAAKLAQYDLIALPVVDTDRKLVGIITHDDVMDVVIEQATEDAHLMGAVQPLQTTYFDSPFWQTVRKRVIWLGGLFLAEMFTSVILDRHHDLLVQFAILVAFMPVITATGGNSGSQAATLITRALALGEVEPRDWWRIALRELFSGLALGSAVGVLGIVAVTAFGKGTEYAVVLLAALVAVTTLGSLVGALMPLFFKRVGLDPAISSSPFVASVVDVFGVIIYCSIAAVVLLRST